MSALVVFASLLLVSSDRTKLVRRGIAAEKESRSLFLEAGDASESLRCEEELRMLKKGIQEIPAVAGLGHRRCICFDSIHVWAGREALQRLWMEVTRLCQPSVARSGACCLPLPGAGVGGLWLLEPLKSMPVGILKALAQGVVCLLIVLSLPLLPGAARPRGRSFSLAVCQSSQDWGWGLAHRPEGSVPWSPETGLLGFSACGASCGAPVSKHSPWSLRRWIPAIIASLLLNLEAGFPGCLRDPGLPGEILDDIVLLGQAHLGLFRCSREPRMTDIACHFIQDLGLGCRMLLTVVLPETS
eukprot:s641_g14.t2